MNAESPKETKSGHRWFLGTWNNPPEDYLEILKASGAKYGRGQKEVGQSGTPHVQFVLFFADACSYRKVKACISESIHLDGKPGAAKKDICNYVWKDETAVPDTRFEFGKAATITRSSKEKYDHAVQKCKDQDALEVDSEILVKNLMNCLRLEALYAKPSESDSCRGIWYFGKPGTGKSHAARHIYSESLYIKSQNKWWDGYRGQGAVLLDDFDSPSLGHLLKIWSDKWACYGEIKGGTVALRHQWFIITSNYLPRELWPNDSMLEQAITRRFLFVRVELINGQRVISSGAGFGDIPKSEDNRLEILPGHLI